MNLFFGGFIRLTLFTLEGELGERNRFILAMETMMK